MQRILFFMMLVLALSSLGAAQNTTLTLLTGLSSRMPTGSAFVAKDPSGKLYQGHVVTHPARRLLRGGSMLLIFSEPVVPVTNDREGVFRGGKKMKLLKFGSSIAAGKLADDTVDGAIGGTKARYIGVAISTALLILQKGSEAKLHVGDTIEVAPRQEHQTVPISR